MTTSTCGTDDRVELLWLPVGAGGHVVRRTSAWWERACALLERRRPGPLFHAALEVHRNGVPYTVEMTPAWGHAPAARGVVATGPVGARLLGRSRLFRYEVRCWPHGLIPDRSHAVGPAVVVTRDTAATARLLHAAPAVPTLTWGRRPSGARDMWNSNSLVAWLLVRAGLPVDQEPPQGGRAPGWRAGVLVAERAADASRPDAP
ncbi:hypothetical protein [Cellulosimicrobium cellulans]|uniref:hypothetical protein n=1 Tax=Cellulosimicrobium cellulans TaxID=1710 RepID=UPI0024060972|nr:hypothetical protein [Cellulosimicrobium cellulans]MDF9878275.1 hypothetical protein [Cellulosimicrobium cellulans]